MGRGNDSIPLMEWKQERRCWDMLEAVCKSCYAANRREGFRLADHAGELAELFGCSPKTIRRALADGAYAHRSEYGAKVLEVELFSAERMEAEHRARWRNKGRKAAYLTADPDAWADMMDELKRPRGPTEFRPSVYAAKALAEGRHPGVKLPGIRTLRSYARDGGARFDTGLDATMLRRRGPAPAGPPRKKGERPGMAGRTCADRPPDVVEAAVPGHLEGDTVCGPAGHTRVYYSFIDRRTSLQVLVPERDRTLESTLHALSVLAREYPGGIRSLTLDRGAEFADPEAMEAAIGARVWYADPHRPSQRARNENNHLLVRRTSPKKAPLPFKTQKAASAAADFINRYPRLKFDGRSALEVHLERLEELKRDEQSWTK